MISQTHMTNLKITGNKVGITGAMEEHVNKKFGKIMENSADQITSVEVHFSKNNNSTGAFKVSADVRVKGATYHAEEFGDTGEEFYSLVDLVSQHIERQLEKRKIKFEAEKRKSSLKRDFSLEEDEDAA